MANITQKQLKKHLQELSEEELREEILRLVYHHSTGKRIFPAGAGAGFGPTGE